MDSLLSKDRSKEYKCLWTLPHGVESLFTGRDSKKMILSCTGDSYACYMRRIPVTEQVQLYYIIYWTEQ